MIKLWQGVVLGIIQGATEFIPVSSSGHLALAQNLFRGFEQPGLLFDVGLHVATSLAVVVYFYKDILGLLKRNADNEVAEKMSGSGELTPINWKLVWVMALAMVPTGIIGFLLKDIVEDSFEQPMFVAMFLVITGLFLYIADLVAKKNEGELKDKDPGIRQVIVIGIAQGLAVFPGISRSGATISAGIFTGVRGDYATRFSFLLSVPAVLCASALSVVRHRAEILNFQAWEILVYLAGMTCAFVVGYFSIKLVFTVVRSFSLRWFGMYCLVVGGATILVLTLR